MGKGQIILRRAPLKGRQPWNFREAFRVISANVRNAQGAA